MSQAAPGPSDALVRKAVGDAQTAFLIVDILADDMPIVYANKAFEDLTGYRQPEILGRNCRFLQRDDRNQPGLGIVRRALKRGESCTVALRNHKKNGDAFVNELRLSPIRDASGTVTHFVGCQSEVPYPGLAALRDEALMRLEKLTERERETLSLMVRGASNKSAARSLGISPRTAEKHRQNVIHKMEVSSVAELVKYAISAND